MIESTTILGWLKAAGEDSRLRLLALCARQELSVSDLADGLRQSEPRVSRHLKILLEAGLLERLRQGQWVHYRLTRDAAAAGFVQGLLALMDRADSLFVRDRERVAAAGAQGGDSWAGGTVGQGGALGGTADLGPRVGGVTRIERGTVAGAKGDALRRAGAATGVGMSGRAVAPGVGGPAGRTSESRLGRALKEFVEAVEVDALAAAMRETGVPGGDVGGERRTMGWPGERSRALVVGVEHLEVLEMAADTAEECVAIAHSRRAAQSAKAFVERRALPCRVLLAVSSNALSEKDLEAAGAPFDVVFLDHLVVPDTPLNDLLAYGRRALGQEGRLWLFERYESLEFSRDKVVEHPIGRLRRLLGDVGLTCERLSPIEADGEHVLAAVAVPSRTVSRGTGAAGAA